MGTSQQAIDVNDDWGDLYWLQLGASLPLAY
jgi:hypothetical protein